MGAAQRFWTSFRELEASDKLDYGVKGMRWGVRKSGPVGAISSAASKAKATVSKLKPGGGSSSASTAKSRAAEKAHSQPAPKPAEKNAGLKAATGEESSSARYDRLVAQAKTGKASDLSDADLKFVNARADALKKVDKLTQTKQSWAKEAAISALKKAAEKQLDDVVDKATDKYVGDAVRKQLGLDGEKDDGKKSKN